MAETIIAWTQFTANFVMGCTKVSEGCRNCYAATLTKNRMGLDLWGPNAPRQVTKAAWENVPKWNHASARGEIVSALGPGHGVLVFVGSLMDWAEDHPTWVEPRARMWALIRESKHLVFQMLTKRPENIARFLPDDWGPDGYDNVWLGTTIEDNRVKARADHLRRVPARVHFISYEPAIGPLDEVDLTDIEWVICGGESGPGHRPLDQAWARDMRDRCVERGIAFFMKQDAAYRTEINPWLVEEDGSKWAWKQYPGKLDPPLRMAA